MKFTVTRIFMKLFCTGSAAVVKECQRYFSFLPVIDQICIRTAKFLQKFAASENSLCLLFSNRASAQFTELVKVYGYSLKSASQLSHNILAHFSNQS